MKVYTVKIVLREIHADDEAHAIEQAEEMLKDGQYSPQIIEEME